MFNILTEPLIRMDTTADSGVPATLPQVYEALMADKVDVFPALRPHQRHAWHAFLVQLGALALHHAGRSTPPDTAEEWQDLIRGLTPCYPNDEPWQLVVEDIISPAFMQPPASAPGKLAEFKTAVEAPDKLDMLVTSKNHDLKAAVAATATINDWLFALVSIQTMAGYDGSKTYGISRMPSGYGNRPAFSITPSTRHGVHIQRDMMALLEHRAVLLDKYEMTDAGIGLVWTDRWDGKRKEVLLPNRLDPFYIEVCRRIRLNWKGSRLAAIRASSDFRRIIDVKGLTGDPWIPIGKKTNPRGTPPAFLGPRKFGYERVVDGLTSPDVWEQPYLLRPLQSEQDSSLTMQLVARGMVRGEGGTEGYHERIISLRPKVIAAFGRAGLPKVLGDIARERIEQVGKVQSILRHAVSVFAAGGNTDSVTDEHRARANPWANKLDEIVDTTFFDALQDEFEADDPGQRTQIRNRWLKNDKDGVVDRSWRILQTAEDSLPCPAIQRFRARVRADNVFWGRIRGSEGLPFLFDEAEKDGKE